MLNNLLYYEICFFASVALSFAYICIWHDGIDVNMTCLFILLPIVNLGCIWMYWAPSFEIAIIANKIVYLAGCFWPMFATKAILSLCNLKIKKVYSIISYVISFVFYGFALTTERPGALYKSVVGIEVDGRYELYPEYGWMHTIIYAVMALYVVIGIVALFYAMKNKLRASIRNMRIMLLGEIVTIIVFFIYGYQKLAGSPAILYVVSMVVFLISGYRSYYYNIDSSVMDSIVVEGRLGYVTFDMRKRLLGCNERAEALFPELKTARADMALDNRDGIKATILDSIEQVENSENPTEVIIPCKDRFISIKTDKYYLRGRKKSYRIIMEDVTDHQNLICLLNKEKDEAEQEKQHVSETFHRYVDPSIAEKLLSDNSEEIAKGEERNIAVLFTDIRGFSTYSEKKEPREVLKLLNMIIETTTSCVMANQGMVDKIIGDCVMAVWTNSENDDDPVYHACKAALDMKKAMAELGVKTQEEFGVKMHLGTGINYGRAIVGNVGTEKRSDYTAIGDAVNVASRVEALAAPEEILVTAEVANMLKDRATFSAVHQSVTLRGRTKETEILKLENINN